MPIKNLHKLAFGVVLVFTSQAIIAQATYTTIRTGNWNDAVPATTPWTVSAGADVPADGIPDANDIVIIATTHTVNVPVGSAAQDLTINGTGILNMNTNATTLDITNGLNLNGTSRIQGTGANRIVNSGTMAVSGGASVQIQDIQLNVAALGQIDGTVTFNTGSTASKSFGSMAINNAGIVNIATNNITLGIVGALVMNGASTIQGTSNTRIINAGSFSVSGGAAAIIQQVRLVVTNNAQIDGTLTFNTGVAAKTFGSLTINGTFTNSAFVNPITINGSMINNGTFTQGTGRVTFTGATSNTVTGTAVTTAFGGGITINKGASQANILDVQCVITMSAGGLILTNGTFELTSASTIVPFTADPTFGASARLWCNGGTMNSTAAIDWTFNGTVQVSAGTINFGFAADDRLVPNNGSAGTVNISGGALNVTGRLTGVGASWNYVMTNGVVTVGTIGNTGFNPFSMTTAGSSFSMSGGTIVIERPAPGSAGYTNSGAGGTGFTGGTLQIGDASTPAASTIGIDTTIPIYNLQINSANATGQVQNQDIIVSNNVTISSGTLAANNFNISVGGNWTNNSTFTPGTPGTGVTFNSSTVTQTISGSTATAFYRLVINNTFSVGTPPQIILGVNTSVTNRLTMTSGVVNQAGFSFTITNNVTGNLVHGLTSASGWMYGGNFVRAVPTSAIALLNADGFFPVGTLVDFRPFFVSKTANGSSAGNITVLHTRLATVTTVSFLDVSAGTTVIARRDDSWAVSTSGSAAGATYGIRYGGTGLGVVFSLAHLHSILSASAIQTHVAASTVSLSDPRVERSNLNHGNMTNTFYVGSDNVLSSLPIELLNFTAVNQPHGVELNWATASELNNDFFTIERASDIEKFEQVKIVKGQGTKGSQTNYNALDENPLAGTSYYRLKQTDFDGKIAYSGIRKIDATDAKFGFKVYPNPAIDRKYNFELSGFNPGDEVPINVFNSVGASVYGSIYKADQNGSVKDKVDLSALPSGFYIMRINAAIGLSEKILIR